MNSKTDQNTSKIIAIDGPAGSGKSTVAQLLAERLGWIYVTTGAIYRTLAFMLFESKTPVTDHGTIDRYAAFLNERYRQETKSGGVFLGDREVTFEIKAQEISKLASMVAQDEYVRAKLLPLQRKIALECNGAVIDGRDMGTVVFPNAILKIFLTANLASRSQRRATELTEHGVKVEIQHLTKEIEERDNRDALRMIQASDAIHIDSTHMNPDAVANQILELYFKKQQSLV